MPGPTPGPHLPQGRPCAPQAAHTHQTVALRPHRTATECWGRDCRRQVSHRPRLVPTRPPAWGRGSAGSLQEDTAGESDSEIRGVSHSPGTCQAPPRETSRQQPHVLRPRLGPGLGCLLAKAARWPEGHLTTKHTIAPSPASLGPIQSQAAGLAQVSP